MKINQHNKNYHREGYWEGHFGNGQLAYKGNYKNDEMVGYWECYYRNGELEFKGYYLVH
jgi:antitoxin component YwqK of YwqJK toxin-antitoxin module